MIRQNELKIKTSNKRLFSDISLQNTIPNINLATTTTTATTMSTANSTASASLSHYQAKSAVQTPNDDETDGKTTSKVARISHQVLSTTTKLGSMPNTNLVTMVIPSSGNGSNGSGSQLMGSSFAKKLQDIQSERFNAKWMILFTLLFVKYDFFLFVAVLLLLQINFLHGFIWK